jgi:hypothetical protein
MEPPALLELVALELEGLEALPQKLEPEAYFYECSLQFLLVNGPRLCRWLRS